MINFLLISSIFALQSLLKQAIFVINLLKVGKNIPAILLVIKCTY